MSPTPSVLAMAPLPAGQDPLVEKLSPRQVEIVALVAKGLTNDDIARVLTISPATVRTHMTAVMAALQVTNRTEAAAAWLAWSAGTARVSELLARPALAVLPILPIGDDVRLARIAAALSEDLSSLFARWCRFPVIAQASTRRARESGDPVSAIGNRLGARFLVDASLRAAHGGWRLTVQVHDAATGYSLWSERYEFPDREVFDAEDEICTAIVVAVYSVVLANVGQALWAPARTTSLDAWELAHEALLLFGKRERGANREALGRADQSLERDPSLPLAHFARGLCAFDAIVNQWGDAGEAQDVLGMSAERCVQLAPHAGEGYLLAARHCQARAQHERAIDPLRRAIALNPSLSSAHGLLAQVLVFAGRPDESTAPMQHAVRLGPGAFVAGLAAFHYARGENREALEQVGRALAAAPDYQFARILAVAIHWSIGERGRAMELARLVRQAQPDFCFGRFATTFGGSGYQGVNLMARAFEALGLDG